MTDKYVEECKSFKWLQGNWKPEIGDRFVYGAATNEIRVCDEESVVYARATQTRGDKIIFLPYLHQIISLMGFEEWMDWHCAKYVADETGAVLSNLDDYTLACLLALKKVKGK